MTHQGLLRRAPLVVDQRFEDFAVLTRHLGDDMGLRRGEIEQRRVVDRLPREEIDDVSIAGQADPIAVQIVV